MKRFLAVVLTVIMTLTLIMPVQTFAQDAKELEKVINILKTKVDIPEKLSEFNYSISTRDGKTIWDLSWYSKTELDGRIYASIRQDGTILNYSHYKSYDGSFEYGKLPKLSREEAQKKAMEFIRKVNPRVITQIKARENVNNDLMNTSYVFYFNRIVNNIQFPENNIYVDVDKNSGHIQNYHFNWNDDIKFPSNKEIISLEDAKNIYKDKIGLVLNYDYRIEDEKIITYLTYKPKYSNQYIDAITGERVQLQGNYYGPYYRESLDSTKEAMKNDALTPQEQKAVDEVSTIISSAEAEKIARDTSVLELTSEFKINYQVLHKDRYQGNKLFWGIEFTTGQTKADEVYKYVYVQVDAITGKILNFNKYSDTNGKEVKYDKQTSKDMTEKFLKEFCADEFNNSVYDDNNEQVIIPYTSGEEKPLTNYSFRYLRKVNGVPFEGNYINVNFDAVNGKITNYYNNWFEAEFESLDKAVSIEKAYETLFNKIGYEISYKLKYNAEVYEKYSYGMMESNLKPEVKLVYTTPLEKPVIIDAINNIILDYEGKPYKENKASKYSDIEESFAKNEVNTLAEYGISLKGDKFNPKANINQKEYLYLLSRATNPYIEYDLDNNKSIDAMYNELIRQGVVKLDEKHPEQNVTREDAVKFIIRVMRYDKVADLTGIFVNDFKDIAEINPNLVGYVSIAQGLKIINGNDGYFSPKNNITREASIKVIYNYLQR